MTIEKLVEPRTYTLTEFEREFGLNKGDFFAYFDPRGDIPFGPVRQMISKESGGGCIVSAIVFNPKIGFQRIDGVETQKGVFKPLHAIPVTSNVLPPIDEKEAKLIVLQMSVRKGQIGENNIKEYLEKPIPEYKFSAN